MIFWCYVTAVVMAILGVEIGALVALGLAFALLVGEAAASGLE